jgi:FdrA protein
MAIIFLDFILGYNSALDPAGELLEAIQEARRMALGRHGTLTVEASVCGTEADPQDLNMQVKLLKEAGVLLYRSSARAAAACAWLLGKG